MKRAVAERRRAAACPATASGGGARLALVLLGALHGARPGRPRSSTSAPAPATSTCDRRRPARLALQTGSGDVTVRRTSPRRPDGRAPGPATSTAAGLVSAATVVDTGSGDVDLSFGQDPTTVQASTGSGDLTVARAAGRRATTTSTGTTGSGDFTNHVRSIDQAPPAGTRPGPSTRRPAPAT